MAPSAVKELAGVYRLTLTSTLHLNGLPRCTSGAKFFFGRGTVEGGNMNRRSLSQSDLVNWAVYCVTASKWPSDRYKLIMQSDPKGHNP